MTSSNVTLKRIFVYNVSSVCVFPTSLVYQHRLISVSTYQYGWMMLVHSLQSLGTATLGDVAIEPLGKDPTGGVFL